MSFALAPCKAVRPCLSASLGAKLVPNVGGLRRTVRTCGQSDGRSFSSAGFS